MTTTNTYRFSAIDTLFFKEARSMESSGELSSLFPPPPNTLVGAIRTAIGESTGVDWADFARLKHDHPLASIIGFGKNTGPLNFKGIWLSRAGERLFPVPLSLLRKQRDTATKDQYVWLQLRTKTEWCDLGEKVRLPALPATEGDRWAGAKPIATGWVPVEEYEQLLGGVIPKSLENKLLEPMNLYQPEPRLGISRNNARATIEEGMLYQTEHMRIRPDLGFEVDTRGLNNERPEKFICRLGGEGRMASASITDSTIRLPQMPDVKNANGLILYLLTPALLNASRENPLPEFKPTERQGVTCWLGEINQVPLCLYAAVTGKPYREGGWDMASHSPKEVGCITPAGSCFYVVPTDTTMHEAASKLHGSQIGQQQTLGRGQIAVGVWNDTTATGEKK